MNDPTNMQQQHYQQQQLQLPYDPVSAEDGEKKSSSSRERVLNYKERVAKLVEHMHLEKQLIVDDTTLIKRIRKLEEVCLNDDTYLPKTKTIKERIYKLEEACFGSRIMAIDKNNKAYSYLWTSFLYKYTMYHNHPFPSMMYYLLRENADLFGNIHYRNKRKRSDPSIYNTSSSTVITTTADTAKNRNVSDSKPTIRTNTCTASSSSEIMLRFKDRVTRLLITIGEGDKVGNILEKIKFLEKFVFGDDKGLTPNLIKRVKMLEEETL